MSAASWIVEAITPQRVNSAGTEAARALLKGALALPHELRDEDSLRFTAEALDLAVFDLFEEAREIDTLRRTSEYAFELLRVLPVPQAPMEAGRWLLRLGCLGVLGERGPDASRFLKTTPWPPLPVDDESWLVRTEATVLDAWLRLIRKAGWDDLDKVQQRILALRASQAAFEAEYLEGRGASARTDAWTLVAYYHLAKAAEILGTFSTQGAVGGHYDVREQLESQFDRALIACGRGELIALEASTRLLARTARQLVDNSIWTVTRGVNSRVEKFVQRLVGRGHHRPIFELLPPQRRALREQGLLGSGHRSVVVSLPTSSGKTFIAQFRIIQALNQFDRERGWVAYLVPTRALVNQICTRLRRDFEALGITVERVSPALEVDGLEARLLTDRSDETSFRVLVTTPEKLDLMLRGGWEKNIGRPLTLVVVDEAHNLGQEERGIRLELLLATINRECRHAQFLLLTPFIQNADEIAGWLAPDSNQSIEIGLDWSPNDLAVVLSSPEQGDRPRDFTLRLQTLHTSRRTLHIPEPLVLREGTRLGLTWSEVKGNFGALAAVTANALKSRGPVIVLAQQVRHTWSIAETLSHADNLRERVPEEVGLVQAFLAEEFGRDFPALQYLRHGVGVHHAGLSDEAKALMEWLLEGGKLDFLVATTTIAQGVNFPVSGVVLASHQYPYGQDMPPPDFWNVAGRAGRVDQGSVGIVAFASTSEARAEILRRFVKRNVVALNSTLIGMVQAALQQTGTLELHRLFHIPEWSAFLQYLAHTYRQVGDHELFATQVEQVLRGALGFQELRRMHPDWANQLVSGVRRYAERLSGKSLNLVDSTGFSWESVSITLRRLADERITKDAWDAERLFEYGSRPLQRMMGVLLQVPELRENLERATGGRPATGDLLARMVIDWVKGASLVDMAREYFSISSSGKPVGLTQAITECCQDLFGRLTQTASWGLAALQALTFRDTFDRLPQAEQETLRNLPARVFYGVNSDEAIALRLIGVPRRAAQPLADELMERAMSAPPAALRAELARSADVWERALGSSGSTYRNVWKVLEGTM